MSRIKRFMQRLTHKETLKPRTSPRVIHIDVEAQRRAAKRARTKRAVLYMRPAKRLVTHHRALQEIRDRR